MSKKSERFMLTPDFPQGVAWKLALKELPDFGDDIEDVTKKHRESLSEGEDLHASSFLMNRYPIGISRTSFALLATLRKNFGASNPEERSKEAGIAAHFLISNAILEALTSIAEASQTVETYDIASPSLRALAEGGEMNRVIQLTIPHVFNYMGYALQNLLRPIPILPSEVMEITQAAIMMLNEMAEKEASDSPPNIAPFFGEGVNESVSSVSGELDMSRLEEGLRRVLDAIQGEEEARENNQEEPSDLSLDNLADFLQKLQSQSIIKKPDSNDSNES